MFLLLLACFVVVPIVELYVIVQVARSVGVLETLGLLIVVSLVGAWLVRHEGLGVLRRIQERLAAGALPTTELVDGGLILLAGALLLTPGFVTDALGVLVLFPPTRVVVRRVAVRSLRHRVVVTGPGFGPRTGSRWGGYRSPTGYVDVDEAVVDPEPPRPPRPGPELGP